MDMSKALVKGVTETFPNAELTFDRFHATKLIRADGLDEVRRGEQKERPKLRKSRCLWLLNTEDLTNKQHEKLASLRDRHLETARAYALKLAFQDFHEQPHVQAGSYLEQWHSWAIRSQLPAMVKAARTAREHWQEILNYTVRKSQTVCSRFNGLFQATKRMTGATVILTPLSSTAYLIADSLATYHHPASPYNLARRPNE